MMIVCSGGRRNSLSKLDLNSAYQQIPLAEESHKCVVINTHCGLFCYNRMPFGVSSVAGIFQCIMENLLKGVRGVVVYLDNILVSGKSKDEHLATLEEVLQRLVGARLHLKREKYTFLVPSVTYLGYRIDSQGLHSIPEKVCAIQNASEPHNQSSPSLT